MVSSDVSGAESVDSDTLVGPLDSQRETQRIVLEAHLDGKLLDDRRGGSLGRVVEDLVDTLVDDLGRHGRGEDDGTLLVARLGPEVGGSLGTSELTPNVDIVCL